MLQANVLFSTGNSTSTVQGKAYYLDPSENWILADYNNSANKLVALARGTVSDVNGMWIGSNENDISLNVPGDIGSVLFLDLSGNLTTTKPLIANSLIRQVGYKLSNNYIKYILSFNLSFPTEATLLVGGGLISYTTVVYVNSSNTVIGSPTRDGETIYIFQDTGLAPGTTRTGTVTPNFVGNVEYLVVAGGAGGGSGGGSYYGGGGGAGGYRTNYGGAALPVIISAYTLTVGSGGSFQIANSANGTSGTNSVFSTITSTGGGGGSGSSAAASGGSGGGASLVGVAGTGNAGGFSPVEGYRGGNYNTGGQGAPGGGASGPGFDSFPTPTLGLSNNITGSAVTYAYGGGGNPAVTIFTTPGSGGNGGRIVTSPEYGQNGRAGIVVLRFPSFF